MTPATIISHAETDGVALSPTLTGGIKATGARDAVARWLPHIRENKPAILAALRFDPNDAPRYRWLVILADGSPFEVCCSPELTEVEMRALYTGATLEPLPDTPTEAPGAASDDPR